MGQGRIPPMEDDPRSLTSPSGIAMLARAMEWMRGHEKLCDEGRADFKRMVDLLHTRIASLRSDLTAGLSSIRSDLRDDRERELNDLDARRVKELAELDEKWATWCANVEKAIEDSKKELKESTAGWRKLAWWAITGVCGIQFIIIGWLVVNFIFPRLMGSNI